MSSTVASCFVMVLIAKTRRSGYSFGMEMKTSKSLFDSPVAVPDFHPLTDKERVRLMMRVFRHHELDARAEEKKRMEAAKYIDSLGMITSIARVVLTTAQVRAALGDESAAKYQKAKRHLENFAKKSATRKN